MFKPFSKMMFRLALMSSALVGLLALTGVSQAHELRPAVADVTVTKLKVKIELLLTVETLLAGIDLTEVINTDDAPQAKIYDQLRSLTDVALADLVRKEWPLLASGFLVKGGGSLKLNNIEVIPETNLDLPRDTMLTISTDLPMGDHPVALGWIAQNGGLVVRHGVGDDAYAAFLDGGELSAPLPRDGSVDESKVFVFLRFVVEGFEHIIPKGLDHILFVFGLFLFSLAWRPLLSQVTAFTLAHTVTLGLATLNVITIPAAQMWLVEVLIAVSIAYVAIENILRPKLGWWRIVVVFGFGLLHGLGFASVLGDLGLAQGQFILSLIAFNIGVELGQLAVIALAFIILAVPFGRFASYQKIVVVPCSLGIAIVGIWWAFERSFL
ncbi:MAG: HupE/UreJ family protein [Amylibacter sp.]|jgi:hypothetical protein|tara:strand:- start:9188 stop:10333 length:1146 start_codon:yes stop_codon:yes gene_type:complete